MSRTFNKNSEADLGNFNINRMSDRRYQIYSDRGEPSRSTFENVGRSWMENYGPVVPISNKEVGSTHSGSVGIGGTTQSG